MKKRISTLSYIFYGLGVGYFMLDQVWNQWLQYFYLPPENASWKPIMSATNLFIALALIRVVDAISDLFVGHMSDNSKAKMGKRSIFMFLGGVPLGISTILFFYPPQNNQLISLIYFVIIGSIYYITYTMVGAPYNAMVADFSKDSNERINFSTAQSVFRLIFTALPLIFSGSLIHWFGKQNTVHGIRSTVILFSIASVFFIYLCIFLLKEPQLVVNYVKKHDRLSFKESLKLILRKDVILYFIGFFLFFSGFNVIRNILTYYSTLVLNRTTAYVTVLSAVLFLSAAIFFPITNILAKKYGNRKVMIVDLILIIIPVFIIAILRVSNIPLLLLLLFFIGAGFSGSAFIFPPAMLSDIAAKISKDNNTNIEGFMFGIQGFCLKLAFLLQTFITTIIIVIGSPVINGKQSPTIKGLFTSMILGGILLSLSTIFYYLNKTKWED